MPIEYLLIAGFVVVVILLLALLLRKPAPDTALAQAVAALQAGQDRQAERLGALQGEVKAELARHAGEHSRELSGFTAEQTKLLAQDAEETRARLEQHRTVAGDQIGLLQRDLRQGIADLHLVVETLKTGLAESQAKFDQALAAQMLQARELIDRKAEESRSLVDARLKEMREANDTRLAEIQKTVNEQLHSAVEKQMNDSFARVIDQFTAVQKAMSDVQQVTTQIGDLRRLFSNVKARGGWGEAQLKALLDDVLGEQGYQTNVRLQEGSADVVEFAIHMPMRAEEPVLLPVDAKFPAEDYDRLQQAAEAGDADAERSARRGLETRLRLEAAKISQKYICPPRTVEFAVLYLPTEGLYAEAARMPGLLEQLHRECRVIVLGPSLMPAMLRTIQLGHVTLALSKNAESVQKLLGATKSEMQKMDEVLERLGKQAGTFGNTIEQARQRTRVVRRKLRDVEQLEASQAEALLELEEQGTEEP